MYPNKEARIEQIMKERGYTRIEAEEVVAGKRKENVIEYHGVIHYIGTIPIKDGE